MSANFKCYDPATGRVLFDATKNTTRILHTISVARGNSGSVTIHEQGQPFAFWLSSSLHNDGYIIRNGELVIHLHDRTINYSNRTSHTQTLLVGVAAI